MNLGEYVLESKDLDWPALLAPWEHLLPAEVTPWFLNRFGEPILVFPDGSIHLLTPELESIKRLADSREALVRDMDDPGKAEALLRMSEIDVLVRAGLALRPGQCYGFKIPLVMGEGARTVENVRAWDISVYYSFLADVHRQTRDLPDGARVRLRFRRTGPAL